MKKLISAILISLMLCAPAEAAIRYLDFGSTTYPLNTPNYSLLLDGTNEYVSNTSLSTTLTGDFSAGIWFKSNFVAADSYIMQLSDGTNTAEVFVRNSDKYLCLSINGTVQNTSSTNYNDSAWHSLVMTRSGNVIYVYVDNTQKLSYDLGLARSYTRFYAGGRAAGTNCWEGYIDEAVVYHRLWTANDIADWSANSSATDRGIYYHASDTFPTDGTSMATNVVLVWHFDEGTGTATTADGSGNGNTGTLNNIEVGDWIASSGSVAVYSGRTKNTCKRDRFSFGLGSLVAGDVVRIKKTADPTLVGTGNWTSGLEKPFSVDRGTVTSTNATPIVVTKNSHGYSSGDVVFLYNHNQTNANGVWRITKVDNNSFSLDGSVGGASGGTASGQLWRITSRCVVLDTAVNYTIDGVDGTGNGGNFVWTPGTNCTTTLYSGITSARGHYVSTNASVTSGQKLCFTTTASNLDLSGYQQITLWLYVTATTAANDLQIKLCSDGAGATAVTTINLPAMPTGTWFPITVDTGGSLGTGINSIALYSTVSYASRSVYFASGVFAVKSSASADSLHCRSIVSKDDNVGSHSYAVGGMYGRVIVLTGINTNSIRANFHSYAGTTESTNVYKREGQTVDYTVTYPTGYDNNAGTSGSPITWSGGWNWTNDTQDGETWLDALANLRTCIAVYKDYVKTERLNAIRFSVGLGGVAANNGFETADFQAVACTTGTSIGSINNCNLSNIVNNMCGTSVNVTGVNVNFLTDVYANSYSAYGFITTGNAALYVNGDIYADCGNSGIAVDLYGNPCCSAYINGDIYARACWSGYVRFYLANNITITGKVDTTDSPYGSAYSGVGFIVQYTTNLRILGGWTGISKTESYETYPYGAYGATFYNSSNVLINGGSFSNAYYGGMRMESCRNIKFRNFTNGNSTEMVVINPTFGQSSWIISEHHDGTTGTHRIYTNNGQIDTETTTVPTGYTKAWKLAMTSSYAADKFPMLMPLGSIHCKANEAKNITIWMRRSNTGLTMRLKVLGGYANGVASDTSTAMTADADTWEKVTVSVTPTEDCVLPVQVEAYGGTTYNGYIGGYMDKEMDYEMAGEPYPTVGGGETSYICGG